MATLKRTIWRRVGQADYADHRTLARWVCTAIGVCWSCGRPRSQERFVFCDRSRWHAGEGTTT